MNHTLYRPARCLLLALALCLVAPLALGEVVITISGGDGSTSSLNQNAQIDRPGADAASDPAQAADSAPTASLSDPTQADPAPAQTADSIPTVSLSDPAAENDVDPAPSDPAQTATGDPAVRAAFIDDIIAVAKKEFDAVRGKAQEAQYSSSIFICKNFTVYLFRTAAEKYRMAEYPDTELKIPDNKPKDECVDYVYGAEWKEMSAQEGNPFYAAAEFRYDADLSKEENLEAAREFMRQVQKGDYFQMAANYYYGVGAHSLVFIADYDPDTDTVHWTDSNMKGEKRNGVRYAYVQYDAEKKIDWFVDAFCRKKYGATLYRLRDDIVYAK